ncbi:Na+/H+ antiporter [Spirosoma pollinicola]|uniref:Na+/H+ antiporter n=1 Tax=Spirosoma pollinicola TaxID=2057025 RepID=A0A2K8Z6U1_9BACT|nr:Na+/H+ antiporter [Spirosoma pollinicola]AUD05568.1 Na+/H+ antiporter [Spirosoma pollinicola]
MRDIVLLGLGLLWMVALLSALADRWRISTPIFLVMGGLIASLIPGVPPIRIDPDLIFQVFLPPLLFNAAWFTSWRELWRYRRIILVLAFGLVILTATAVAYTATNLIPGFSLSLGFLLGGLVSPPDAIAATSVLQSVKAPKSTIAILEGESLINDAASLIVLRFALASVITGTTAWTDVIHSFFSITILGAGVGVTVAGAFYAIQRWLPLQLRVSILLTFLAPYSMYLIAEQLQYSGIIAVVSGGLFLSKNSHTVHLHSERIQSNAMWATLIYIINGLVFMLIGLELPIVLEGLTNYSLVDITGYALLITALVISVRLGFAFISTAFTRIAERFITVAVRNASWRGPFVVGWAGMRGVVSLAAAFSIPLTLPNDAPFPHRPLLLFITFVVIMVTLVLQGLTLPWVVSWVHPQEQINRIPEHEQRNQINRQLHGAALRELIRNYTTQISDNPLLGQLKSHLETNLLLSEMPKSEKNDQWFAMYKEALMQVYQIRRQELAQLRLQPDLDEEVIRKIEAQLDFEEEQIERPIS